MNLQKFSYMAWASSTLCTALLFFSGFASAQIASKLNPEAVSESQQFRDTTLELSVYLFEEGRSYGRRQSTQGAKAPLLVKKSSSDRSTGDSPSAKIGESVVLCVYSSHAGTLTLWSKVDDNQPVMVYPNQFTKSLQGAGPIGADEEVCIGDTSEFRLRVRGKDGQIDTIYAHWAPESGGQLGINDFPQIGKSTRVSRSAATHGAATVRYRISK